MKKLLSFFLVAVLLITVIPLETFEFKASAATSGITGDCMWTLEGTVLTISGNGAMKNYWFEDQAPWKMKVTDVFIENGVSNIGNYAFCDCDNLKSITIGNTVTRIGYDAFCDCDNLENVYITDIDNWCNIDFIWGGDEKYSANPLYYADYLFLDKKPVTSISVSEGITEISPYLFSFSTLKKITLPSTLKSIGLGAFSGCEILSEINIPSNVTSIGFSAFEDCQSLENVYINDLNAWCKITFERYDDYHRGPFDLSNPLYYADNLYLNGEPLTDLVIPEEITEIPSYLFSSATIKNITIPNTVTEIGDYAFKDCSGLESIYIPNSITNVGNNAFENCINLKRVYLCKEYMIIKNGTFNNCNNIAEVYYGGSEEDWESVAILLNNGSLSTAKVIFNAIGLPNDSITAITGDVDGDGRINLNDLVTLAQYTAGWQNLEINEDALDVNGDRVVDLQDVTHFARYLAGWEGYDLIFDASASDGWTGEYIIK